MTLDPGPKAAQILPPRPRVGQILLAVTLVAVIVLLIAWSFLATRAHEIERATVFAEEADSTAMTFVQRESFNTLLALEKWASGDVGARDVQIARASLGQRLGVRVSSGAVTGEIVQDGYRAALTALDVHLLQLGDVSDDERQVFRNSIGDDVDAFLAETRELSRVFQALTREQVTTVLEDRAQAERVQAFLSGIILVAGVALAAWISRDIGTYYRRTRERLAVERHELELLRRRFTAIQLIGLSATRWHDLVDASVSSSDLVAIIRADLARYVPDIRLEFDPNAPETVDIVGKVDRHNPEDLAYVKGRITDALQAWWSRERARAALEHERSHDALTGLPNRLSLPSLLEGSRRDCRLVALAVLDVDRFTDVNSAFGEAAGDDLLRVLAHALSVPSELDHHVVRLASDDFAIIMGGADAYELEERMRAVIRQIPPAVSVERGIAPLSVSAGLVIVGSVDAGSVDAVLARALAALQVSRVSTRRNEIVLFDPARHADLLVNVTEEEELRDALSRGDIGIVVQPIMQLSTRDVVGMEALARWYRGDEIVGPDHFLPIVHRAGLFDAFAAVVTEQALAAWQQVAEGVPSWDGDGQRPYIAINVHPRQLSSGTFVDNLSALAEAHRVPTACIVCEITEDAVANAPDIVAVLTELREQGFRVAIDDFGTGYSSLGQAASLPFDILKIDRSFVPRVGMDDAAGRLFGDLVGIGRTLNAELVAEGVESAEVAAALTDLGVNFAQGYYFARPMAVEAMVEWVAATLSTRTRG